VMGDRDRLALRPLPPLAEVVLEFRRCNRDHSHILSVYYAYNRDFGENSQIFARGTFFAMTRRATAPTGAVQGSPRSRFRPPLTAACGLRP
jgi:hypothetical protein